MIIRGVNGLLIGFVNACQVFVGQRVGWAVENDLPVRQSDDTLGIGAGEFDLMQTHDGGDLILVTDFLNQ